jgi:hypothetical protein
MLLGTSWADRLSPYPGDLDYRSLTQRRKVAKISKIVKKYLPLRSLRLGVRIKSHHFNMKAKNLFIRPLKIGQGYEQILHRES